MEFQLITNQLSPADGCTDFDRLLIHILGLASFSVILSWETVIRGQVVLGLDEVSGCSCFDFALCS